MTKEEAQGVEHGLYRIHWKDGGTSLASVGSDASGRRWFAPTNWITVPWFDWCVIHHLIRLDLSSETVFLSNMEHGSIPSVPTETKK